jgi:integrase
MFITDALPKLGINMGRAVKDAKLDKRDTRIKLAARKEPYWRLVSEGAHLGYYRGERTNKWVARFRKPGTAGGYVKTTLGEADDVRDADGHDILTFAQADQAARQWFADKARGGKKIGPFTVNDALDEYLVGFRGKTGAIPSDLQSRVDGVIRPALGHLDVASLTTKLIADWHEARARSPAKLRTPKNAEKQNERAVKGSDAVRSRRSTANRDLTVLKAALNRAADHRDDLPESAWVKVKPFKNVDVAKRRYLTDDESRRLVNAIEEEFRPMVKAALLTGGRYGELRHARVSDYDRQSKTLWLAETKSASPRPAYLDEEGAEMIEIATAGKAPDDLIFIRPDGKQWDRSQQLRRMIAAFERAKIAKTGFHDLRRTYGARLALRGVPMAVISEAMGHKDERMTRKHYAHLAPSYVSETVRAAISGLGIVEKSNIAVLASK